jgi:hypothetical protein
MSYFLNIGPNPLATALPFGLRLTPAPHLPLRRGGNHNVSLI